MIDELASWVVRLADVLRGEFRFCLNAWFHESFWCFGLDCSCCFCEVLAGRSREEEAAVQSEMSRLDDHAVWENNPFWADGARARSFALLRLRVERVPVALEYCRRVLGGIHAQFYPLAAVPSKLEALCRFFTQPSELRRVMDH